LELPARSGRIALLSDGMHMARRVGAIIVILLIIGLAFPFAQDLYQRPFKR